MIPYFTSDQKQKFLEYKAEEFSSKLASDVLEILSLIEPRPYYMESEFDMSKITKEGIEELKRRVHVNFEYVWEKEIDDKTIIYYGTQILDVRAKSNQEDLDEYIKILKCLAEEKLFLEITKFNSLKRDDRHTKKIIV